MYGAQCTSATPSDSQATRKRTTATSTSVTSSRSNTRRGRSLRTWASSSPKLPDSTRPMSRSVAVSPSDAVSILRVTGGTTSKRRAVTNCFGGGELTSARMPTSRQLPTGRRLPRFERVVLRLARFIRRTARVHPLELGDFLVVNRDGRAAVALFTDEVVTGGGDVTAQARHALEIDHLVPADLDPRGRRRRVGRQGGGQLQGEELPPVCLGKLCLGMLHHGLTRHQLQKGPDGVLGVRDPVPQDAHGFGQSLGVCVPDVGVPDFRTITDAAERLVGDRDILLRLDQPGHDAEHGGRECDAAHPSLFHSLTPLKSPNGWSLETRACRCGEP